MAPTSLEGSPVLALERRPLAFPALFEVEENLLALLDTEELVTPEMEQEFLQDLSDGLQVAIDKRDRVAGFIKACEVNAKMAAEEIARLQGRKKLLESAAERVRKYVTWIIEALGTDPKGKLRKLEGHRFTMSARACPVSVEITKEEDIPRKFRHVTLSGPAEVMDKLLVKAIEEFGRMEPLQGSTTVDRSAVKKALEAGEEVPGAELIVGKYSLMVK